MIFLVSDYIEYVSLGDYSWEELTDMFTVHWWKISEKTCPLEDEVLEVRRSTRHGILLPEVKMIPGEDVDREEKFPK